MGNAFNSLGQHDKAIEFCTRNLVIARQLGDRAGEGKTTDNLGNAFYHLGQHNKAIEFYTKDLDIARELGDTQGWGRQGDLEFGQCIQQP